MTFEEFQRIPNPPGHYYELHHGELFKVAFPKLRHGEAQHKLHGLIQEAAGTSGVVRIEMPYRPLPEHEAWGADVAYISTERWDPHADYFFGAPDLVIEVLSPSNTLAEMREKRDLCLENGSREFWIVDLDRQQVDVSTPDGHTITYKSGQSIPLFFAEGRSLPVDSIFT